MLRRILSMLLVLTLLAGMLPAPAFAEETDGEPIAVPTETDTAVMVLTETVAESGTDSAPAGTESSDPDASAEAQTELPEGTDVQETEDTAPEETEPAVKFPIGGTCGESLTWELTEDGTLTISGTGDMADFDAGTQPWYDSMDMIREVVISEGVTSVGNWAFYDANNLTKLSLPEGLVTICGNAFNFCTGLTEVVIPQGVETIGLNGFAFCSNLTSVTIPDSVTVLGECAFMCTGLTSVTIPASIATIGGECFNSSLLTEAFFEGSAPEIGEDTFAGVTAKLYYPAEDTSWTMDVMQDYGGDLTWIPLDENGDMAVVTVAIGELEGLTWELDNLGVLTISGDGEIPDIIPYPWSDYADRISSVVLEEGITSINGQAFYDLDITEVSLPGTLTKIGYSAFWSCDKLTGLELPLGLQEIHNQAFYNCTALTTLSIPYTVTTIEYGAFNGCDNLTEISFGHSAADTLSLNSYAFGVFVMEHVRVPDTENIHSSIAWYFGSDYAYESVEYTWVSLAGVPARAEVGEQVTLAVSVEPAWARPSCVYSIDEATSTAAASVDENGILTAAETGWVTVRAAIAGNEKVCDETQIQITPATAYVSGITLRCDGEVADEVELDCSVQMIADVQPGNAANKAVTWEVEDGTGSASITEDGVLTGLTPGTVTVYATAADGTDIIGSLVVEVMIYVEDIGIYVDGREDLFEIGLGQYHVLSDDVMPEQVSYGNVSWSVEDGTGSAQLEYSQQTGRYMIKGTAAGTVTLTATAQDSHALSVSRELTVVGETGTYAVTGGNLYYNTVTGAITGCDDAVTVANIPGIIDGTRITAIAPYAFVSYNYTYPSTNSTLTSVTIPSSVTAIGDCAFWQCTAMTSLKFGSGSQLTTIGDYAFYYCTALAGSLTIPAGVADIGKNAFRACRNLTALTIPDSVVSVGDGAFQGLTRLKSLTIPGELDTTDWMSVGGYVDGVEYVLQTLILTGDMVIPQRVTHYANGYAISPMPGRNAVNVIISDTVRAVSEYAFSGIDEIEEVTIGESVMFIGENAFADCDGLMTVYMGSSVEYIESQAFSNCWALAEIELPEGLLALGDGVFAGDTELAELNLPESLESIGENCFAGARNLQLLDLSRVPDVIVQRKTALDDLVTVPSVLVTATGGNIRIGWSISDTNGEYSSEADQVAWIGSEAQYSEYYLWSNSAGTVMLHAFDEYTGARGSKIITVETGVVIDTGAYPGYLVGGKTLQLSALQMPEGDKAEVVWSSSNENYATVSGGKVTAKAVSQPVQVTITATPVDGGDSVSVTLWIVPKTTGMDIVTDEEEVLTGTAMAVEMSEGSTLSLSANLEGMGQTGSVTWTSSDEDVAMVDGSGNVTLLSPGTAVITVKDVYGTTAKVTLNVTYVDTARKLTATADLPAIGLQPTQTVHMQVFGENPIEVEKLTFSSSNEAVAVVDESGRITAVGKGTATITAVLTGDPLGRKAELMVTVIPAQTEQLLLRPEGDFRELVMLDADGSVTDDMNEAAKYVVYMNQADVRQGINTVFTIWPNARDSQGNEIEPTQSGYKWASSNTKVATVKANGQGGVTVTVKNTAAGACVITAVSTDLAKVEQELELHVRDFAPRLAETSFTVNSWLSDTFVSTALAESYGNGITHIELLDEDGAPCQTMRMGVDMGYLFLGPAGAQPKGTQKLTLRLTCQDGNVYDYALKVTVKNSAPSVTVKQSGKLNLFYSDSEAALTIKPKTGTVIGAELADTDDFVLDYDEIAGTAVLRLSDSYDPAVKPDTKATILVYLEGYSAPVSRAITIGTVTTAPKLVMSPASSVINTALGEKETSFQILWNGQVLPLTREDVTVTAVFGATYDVIEDRVYLYLNGSEAGTATVQVQKENWNKPVTLTHKISLIDILPTVSVAGKLTVNRVFHWQKAVSPVSLSQSNLEIGWFDDFVSASSEGEKIWVDYDGENLTACILDAEDLPKAGTYTFTSTPYLSDGTALDPVSVKVSVTAVAPKVKAESATLKLNKVLSGYETASTSFTVSGEGYTLAGFAELEDLEHADISLTFLDGVLMAALVNEEAAVKRSSFSLTPILEDADGNQAVLESKLKVNVQVYSNQRITVALSSKGKLDAAVPDSAITYTVKKISNAWDTIEESDVALAGPDADLFDLEFHEAGQILLKQRPGEVYATNRTYKVQLLFLICGREVESKVLSFKMTQSTLKVSAPKTLTYFQSQSTPLRAVLALTSPGGAALDPDKITINEKKSAAFLKALGGGNLSVVLSEDGRSAEVSFPISSPGRLTAGKSYTVVLDVLPANCAEDRTGKPTQVKLTVKVYK